MIPFVFLYNYQRYNLDLMQLKTVHTQLLLPDYTVHRRGRGEMSQGKRDHF